ncbi:unnamed protein product [Urochloa humidicola]
MRHEVYCAGCVHPIHGVAGLATTDKAAGGGSALLSSRAGIWFAAVDPPLVVTVAACTALLSSISSSTSSLMAAAVSFTVLPSSIRLKEAAAVEFVALLWRCWMKTASSWTGALWGDPRPTCHSGHSPVACGGRPNRLTKQFVCNGVAPVPGLLQPVLRRRRIEAAGGDRIHEDFRGLCLIFLLPEVLCAFSPEQLFPLYLSQLYLYLYVM